jgi:ABC-type transporter Mla maintaining outer membrane lipid asymmetry ATPase subunit MlaF
MEATVEDACVLSWADLTVSVGSKVLLKRVHGIIDGGFTGIMGPSGSGRWRGNRKT